MLLQTKIRQGKWGRFGHVEVVAPGLLDELAEVLDGGEGVVTVAGRLLFVGGVAV
jgi:hypothetical protein